MDKMNLPPAAKAAVEQAISSFGNIRHPQYDGTPQTWCAENKRVLNEQTELVLTAIAPFMEAGKAEGLDADEWHAQRASYENRIQLLLQEVASLKSAPPHAAQAGKGEPEAGFRDIINHVIGQLEPLARQLIHPQENVFQKMIVSLQAARDYPLKSAAPSPRACPATEDWMKEAKSWKHFHDLKQIELEELRERYDEQIARRAPSTEDSEMLNLLDKFHATVCTTEDGEGKLDRYEVWLDPVRGLSRVGGEGKTLRAAICSARTAQLRTPKESNE